MKKKILDIKSDHELKKHKNNQYLKNIKSRIPIKIKYIFNLENLHNNNDYFNINITKFSGFEGSYYYNGKDPLVNTSY